MCIMIPYNDPAIIVPPPTARWVMSYEGKDKQEHCIENAKYFKLKKCNYTKSAATYMTSMTHNFSVTGSLRKKCTCYIDAKLSPESIAHGFRVIWELLLDENPVQSWANPKPTLNYETQFT